MNRSRSRSTRRSDRGVTLLELIVAMAASVAVASSVYAVMITQGRTYDMQEGMTKLQQSMRLAMDFMTRNISLAGYGTRGFALTSISLGVTGSLPAVRVYEGGSGATDAIQVVYADPSKLAMTAWATNQACSSTSLKFQNASEVLYFQDYDYLLCFDIADMNSVKSFLLKKTALDNSTGVVTVSAPTDNPAFSGTTGDCPSTGNYPPDMQCGAANILTFYIDANSSDGIGPGSATHPVLMMSSNIASMNSVAKVTPLAADVALADNIEDLQIQVCSTSISKTCDSTGWTNSSSTDITPTGAIAVKQVRISMWARANSPVVAGSKVASVLNPLTGTKDGYQRQRLRSTMLLRNMRLLDNYN